MSERILDQFDDFELPPFVHDNELSANRARWFKKKNAIAHDRGVKRSSTFGSRQRASLTQRKPKITLATKA